MIFIYGLRSELQYVHRSININSKFCQKICDEFWVVISSIIVEEMRYEIYVISTNVLQKMNILAIMQRLL